MNGKRAKVPPAGLSSATDFSSQLLLILAPESAALFTNQRQDSVMNRPVWRYDFSISQPNSAWRIDAHDDTGLGSIVHYSPAYSGIIWIDKETGNVRKTQVSASKLPDDFPLDTIETVTAYDLVRIGEQQYLTPMHSETYSCRQNSNLCFKDETVFANYRK